MARNAASVARWLWDTLTVRVDRYGYHKAKSRAVSDAPLTLEVVTAHVHADAGPTSSAASWSWSLMASVTAKRRP